MTKTWQVISAFIGIFLLGAVVGSVVSVRISHYNMKRHAPPEPVSPQLLKKFAERQLNLTAEQKAKIGEILNRTGGDLKRLRKESSELVDRLAEEISAQLTEEQRIKFTTMRDKQRQQFRDWTVEQRKRHEGEKPKKRQTPPGPDGKPAPSVQSAPSSSISPPTEQPPAGGPPMPPAPVAEPATQP